MSNDVANYLRFKTFPSYNNLTTEMSDSQSHPFQPNATPIVADPNATPIVAGPTSFLPTPKKELKSWRSLKTLVWLELALAVLMIVFEAIMMGWLSSLQYSISTCAVGIWVGVLGVIAAGLGIGAFHSPYGNKCLTVASFVMTIICVVADGILINASIVCMTGLSDLMRSTSYGNDRRFTPGSFGAFKEPTVETVRGLIAVESFLMLAAVVHMISGIVLTSFICRNWCQESQPDVAMVYVVGTNPEGVENEATDPYRVALPPGAKYVIFVQTGATSQGTPVVEQSQPEFRNLRGGGDGKII